jgi:excisionase family DNA binding protein
MPKSATTGPASGEALPEIYTYEEAAAILKMTPRQVTRACEEGRLGFVKIHGRGRRITSDHIREFIAVRDVRPAA